MISVKVRKSLVGIPVNCTFVICDCISGSENLELWIIQPCPISNIPVPYNICLDFGIVWLTQFKVMSIRLLVA